MNSTAITFVEKPVSKSPVSSDASPGCDYDVFLSFREPADVKWLKGTFGDVFNSYTKRRFGDSDVQEWRQALKEVGSLKGLVSENIANGNEAELIKWVVVKVLSELKNAFKLVTPKHLVGVDIHVKKIMTMVDTKFEDTRILGIHGMGGAGKTTLAKIIYNELSSQFERHGFLADIRETESHEGIVHLQKELISEVLKGSPHEVSNRDHGINIISSRFGGKRVLIFLDDVSDKDQLDALVGGHEFFGFGSRIIITTRDKAILNQFGTSYWAYELMGLDKESAMVLFCRHAFQRDFPPPALNDLCRDIVSTTGQLPLALEVIGSLLCDKSKAAWKDTLKRLREVLYEKVEEKLKISYDTLTNDVKQIFLDIACFFNGTDPRLPIYMWDDCGFSPNLGLELLSLMSLVKIVHGNRGNRLWMHDQLRDLGRSIVFKENSVKPSERSRLWIHEEALKVLERNEGTNQIEALHLKYSPSLSEPYCLTNEQFRKLPNLRYLRIQQAEVTGDFKDLLPKLRWLDWMACSTSFFPTNFHPENLVILNVRVSGLTEHWDAWHHVNGLQKLKVLKLLHCNNLTETPDFSALRNLEILNLEYCVNLVKIHPSIRNIRNLESLSLRGCDKLKELPKEMGRLTNLRELLVDGSSIKRDSHVHSSIGSLQNLHRLSLQGCKSLKTLPDSIGKLTSLTQLRLSDSAIRELPHSIGNLDNLKVLLMSQIFLEILPTTIGRLKKLEELDASECKYLQGEIPSEGLKEIKAGSCLKLVEITGLHNAEHLEELDLSGCSSLERLPDLPCPGTLKYLCINGCEKIRDIQALEEFSSCKTLCIEQCKSIVNLPDLSEFEDLEYLTVKKCPQLMEFPGFDGARSLKSIDISWCEMLENLPDLSGLELLGDLKVRHCGKLMELQGLGGLRFLSVVDFSGCNLLKPPELPSRTLQVCSLFNPFDYDNPGQIVLR
ncbi:hypothetical protein NL676_012432 [Syzygium grande]|nr:hypothetical protein NL676_012432 [Syzygium grande]